MGCTPIPAIPAGFSGGARRRIDGGSDVREDYRRAVVDVDRILNGGKIADLPFQEHTTLALTINAGTARKIGPTIPNSVLVRATEVIE